MAWGSKGTSTALTLGATYAIVQESAADLEIALNPGEACEIIPSADFQAAATENVDFVIERSVDGVIFETAGEAERQIILFDNRQSDDPAERSIWVMDCHTFRIQGRVRDPDDTAGGTDTGSTLTIHYRKNGIDAS